MDSNNLDGGVDAKGMDDLKEPLLKPLDINNKDKRIRTVKFKIGDIECASCATTIESVLGKLDGVKNATVSPIQGQAAVNYIPELITAKKIKEAIEDAGFPVDEFPEQDVAVTQLRIKGMACTSCSESVESALRMIAGVKNAVVGLALEEAKVHFDPSLTDTSCIIQAIEDAGFGADLISSGNDVNKVHLKLEGVNSPEDMSIVQSSLESVEGVNNVEVDFAEKKVTIAYDSNLTGPRSLIHCVEKAGRDLKLYQASLYVPPRRREAEQKHEIQMYRNQFFLSCLFSVPIFFFSMVLPMLPPYGNWLEYKVHNTLTVGMLLRWILCTPVQFIVGRRFYVGSYHALRRRSANMDVLVALGTNVAYFYSVYIAMKALALDKFEGQDFFETSSMLISFILLGKFLEVIAKGKTSDALAKLTDLAPDTAYLLSLDDDGNVISEMEISTQLIQRNDILKIVPGAKVPADGIVVSGQSYVNESMITGEARPIAKRLGDKVIGGTINENGCLQVKATHVGAETALSQIVQLVEAAQLARAPVQKLADQISKFFVPTVVIAAFLTWLGWFILGEFGLYPKHWIPKGMDKFELALQFGISVLVVACPCALGLATPTAVMVATGKGASQGVLIKGGNSLEKAHKVKTVVFDKTGTLTVGKPEVVSAVLFSNYSMEEFCAVATAAEANSEHPIAKSIVEHAKRLLMKFGSTEHVMEAKDFEVHTGAGVRGRVGDKMVLVGNKRLMRDCNVQVRPEVEEYVSENEKLARTCVLVAIDGKVAGSFAVTDPVKPEAVRVISYLHSMSISSIMVTGDNWATAAAIAKEVGIDKVFAETDPLGKADRIKELQLNAQKARMSPTIIAILLVFLTFLCSLIHTIITASSSRPKLPPGPRALPIIGNLHMLGNLPHRSLQHLAKKYGPIMSMRLGNTPAIVVSSPTAAELFLKTHDTIFASRPKVQASEYMSYGTKGMAFTEYGPYWRHIRKLCTLQLLCPSKIEGFAPLRREEVGLFIQSLKKAAAAGEMVDLSEKVGGLVEDITYRMVLGSKNDDMFDLKGTIEEALFLSGAFNIGDYMPFLSPLDLQGLAKRMKRISKTIDQLFEKIIGEHEQVSKSGQVQDHSHKDFVDVLLSLIHQPLNPNDEQVYMMERTNVKAILLDMISGAFDTSATAIVWTLAELLRHPRVMKHLQGEIQSVIGTDRMVEESDLPKLGYLSMVVKESLRLHPVAPFLIPHESMEDITVEGFDVPKKSRIFINTWAIGRDPKVWSENVEEFYPERFIDGNIDLRGHDFQLLPFGSGRRGCPAMQLGLITVRLALANLVHCFNWELPSGLKPEDLDMTEKFGLSLSKAKHLFAMPTYRLCNQLS